VNQELSGKTALVTGSGRGIGKAIAFKLAGMGARIAVNDLPETAEAAEVVKEIESRGGQSLLVPGNITDTATVKNMINLVVEKWGPIDILVNNAGITRNVVTLRMSEDDWDSVDVN
jgi:3-oxoacyl-[acyl-carrier protein] reductase